MSEKAYIFHQLLKTKVLLNASPARDCERLHMINRMKQNQFKPSMSQTL